jgi:hypothetical protein
MSLRHDLAPSIIIMIIDNMHDLKANRVLAALIEHAAGTQHVEQAMAAHAISMLRHGGIPIPTL